MDKETKIRDAKELLEKAETRLKETKLLYENGFYEGSLSRAYYAVHSAAKAILALLGYEPKTHGEVRKQLGFYVIKAMKLLNHLSWKIFIFSIGGYS